MQRKRKMGLPMIDPEKTGENIKVNMKKAGYTAIGLAEVMGIADKSTVYKWFRGETLPDIGNIVALAAILDVKMDDLIAIA